MCDFKSIVVDIRGEVHTDASNSHAVILNALDVRFVRVLRGTPIYEFGARGVWPFEGTPANWTLRGEGCQDAPPAEVHAAAYSFYSRLTRWLAGDDLDHAPERAWDVFAAAAGKSVEAYKRLEGQKVGAIHMRGVGGVVNMPIKEAASLMVAGKIDAPYLESCTELRCQNIVAPYLRKAEVIDCDATCLVLPSLQGKPEGHAMASYFFTPMADISNQWREGTRAAYGFTGVLGQPKRGLFIQKDGREVMSCSARDMAIQKFREPTFVDWHPRIPGRPVRRRVLTGNPSIRAFGNEPPDLSMGMISDIEMPDLEGRDLQRWAENATDEMMEVVKREANNG
jgi:hypothetical protein